MQIEIYFLREEIRRKNFISSIFQPKKKNNKHTLPNSSKHKDQLPDQKEIRKYETNTAELENMVIEINNLTEKLNKITHTAIPTNVINLNSESNSSSVIQNIQDTHELFPSVSSNTSEKEEEMGSGSKTAKEQK